MPEYEAISHNLKQIRKFLQKTQEEFASECGISAETLSLLERKLTDPKLSTIQKIAAYVGCEVTDLLKMNSWTPHHEAPVEKNTQQTEWFK